MKKSLLQGLSFNSYNINANHIDTINQLKNTESMSDIIQINPNNYNNNSTFKIGLIAPEGMRWDLYGNPEIVEC